MKSGSILAIAVLGVLALYIPTAAQSTDKPAQIERWSIVDTAQGAVRIDSASGQSYLLDTRIRAEPKWIEIAEPPKAKPSAESSGNRVPPAPDQPEPNVVDIDAWANVLKVVVSKEGDPIGVWIDENVKFAKAGVVRAGWTILSLDGNAIHSLSDLRKVSSSWKNKKGRVVLEYRDANGLQAKIEVEPSVTAIFGELEAEEPAKK